LSLVRRVVTYYYVNGSIDCDVDTGLLDGFEDKLCLIAIAPAAQRKGSIRVASGDGLLALTIGALWLSTG
jgi:hypothetical protein